MKGKQGVVFEWMRIKGKKGIREVSEIITGNKGRREEGITTRMDVQYKGSDEEGNKIRPVCFGCESR